MTEEIERCPNKGAGVEFLEHLHRYRVAQNFCIGKRVLDAACGSGYGSDILAEKAESVKGVDISEDAINLCNQTYQRKNLKYLQASVAELPFENHSFDVVVSFETIEHVPEDVQQKFLKEIRRVLVPGGLLIMSSPDKTFYTLERKKVNPYHIAEFTRNEFVSLIKQNFKYCTFADQRIYLVSLLNEADPEHNCGMKIFSTTMRENTHPKISDRPVKNYWYNIALASDEPVEHIGNSLNLDLNGDVFSPDGKTPQESYIETLHDHIRELDAERNDLISERKEQLDFIEDAGKHIKSLDDERNALIAERENLISERKEHLEFIENAEKHIKSLDDERNSLIKERENLISERKEHLEFIENAEKHIKSLDDERNALISERENLISERKEHLEFIENAEKHIKSLDDERENLISERKEHLEFIENAEKHIKSLDDERENLISERKEHLEFIENAEKHIKSLDDERDALIKERTEHLAERKEHLEFIEKCQDHIKELDAQKETLLQDIDSLQKERLEHISYIDQCTAHIQKQDSERETLQTMYHEHVSYIEKCQKHISALDTEIAQLKQKKEEQSQQISALNDDAIKQKEVLTSVSNILKETEKRNEGLQQELQQIRETRAYRLLKKLNIIK